MRKCDTGNRNWIGLCARVGVSLGLMTGCAQFGERHYFGAFDRSTGEVVNFYRLDVSGKARFSSARYLSGAYDERALDLFFNEMRTSEGSKSMVFVEGQMEPGTETVIKGLSPNSDRGAFVLILSTNADAVANTIGSFAESQVVARAIANLISAGRTEAKRRSDANIAILKSTGAALETQLATQLVEAGKATTAVASERAYRRMLITLARGLGHDETFSSFDDARRWFQLERRTSSDD